MYKYCLHKTLLIKFKMKCKTCNDEKIDQMKLGEWPNIKRTLRYDRKLATLLS